MSTRQSIPRQVCCTELFRIFRWFCFEEGYVAGLKECKSHHIIVQSRKTQSPRYRAFPPPPWSWEVECQEVLPMQPESTSWQSHPLCLLSGFPRIVSSIKFPNSTLRTFLDLHIGCHRVIVPCIGWTISRVHRNAVWRSRYEGQW